MRERTVETSLGDEEELVCRVTGVPTPRLTWYRNNKVIDKRTSNILLNERAGRHSLTLLNIDQDMVGEYQCVASNSEGSVSESITLTGDVLCTPSAEQPQLLDQSQMLKCLICYALHEAQLNDYRETRMLRA